MSYRHYTVRSDVITEELFDEWHVALDGYALIALPLALIMKSWEEMRII